MIRSYLTTALRNFRRNKLHALINMFGLSLGIAASILALMFVLDESSFDRLHTKSDRIYRLNKINTESDGSQSLTAETSGMMGPIMVGEFVEVEKAVRYQPWFNEVVLSHDTKNVVVGEHGLAFADSTFFEVFDFELLRGEAKNVLSRPATIVLTSSVAEALFGDDDPVGKRVIGLQGIEFEVTGIAAAPPRNSHIQFTALVSWMTTVPQLGPIPFDWMNNWIAQGISTYLLVRPRADISALSSKFPRFMTDHLPTRAETYALYLQPLDEVYLHSYNLVGADMARSGNIQYVYLFSTIAGFILLIACINYINISTSKSATRSREVGMRKTMGAAKGQLVRQFLGESLLLSALSAALAVLLLYLAVPYFNSLAGKQLPIGMLMHPLIIGGAVTLVGIVSLGAGIYPALVLSGFSPARIFSAHARSSSGGNWPRYVLITFQFFVSITMIAATLLVFQQIRYVLSKDLGFDKEHVLVVSLSDDIMTKRETFKNEVDAMPGVVSVSTGRTALGHGSASTYIIPEGFPPDEIEVRMFPSDCDFLNTYGLQLTSGRFFEPGSSSDSSSLVINEALARKLHWDTPMYKTIKFNEGQPALPIIGVLKDFHFKSLYDEVEPLVMWISPRNQRNLSVRFTGDPSRLLKSLDEKWKTYEARYPINFYFVDQEFAKNYESEGKLFRTVITFASISLIIACLGLYGLVSLTIQQRTREFGIRKVLGASVTSLNMLVNRKFVLLVLAASLLAIPLTLRLVGGWLEKFAFKIEVSAWPFLLAVLITLLITVVAVSSQALKVALRNPVDALRSE